MIKGFFFDLDGTLVNTYEADFLAYRDAVQEVAGLELVKSKYVALHGLEIRARLAQLFPQLSPEQIQGIRDAKKRLYRNHVHLTELNDGLVSFLAQFSSHITCVLVTTAKQDNLDVVFEQHDLRKYFSVIISGDDVAKHKPDPEAYFLALKKTGLKPEEVIAFEDSASGIESAEAAGITVVPVKEFAAL